MLTGHKVITPLTFDYISEVLWTNSQNALNQHQSCNTKRGFKHWVFQFAWDSL